MQINKNYFIWNKKLKNTLFNPDITVGWLMMSGGSYDSSKPKKSKHPVITVSDKIKQAGIIKYFLFFMSTIFGFNFWFDIKQIFVTKHKHLWILLKYILLTSEPGILNFGSIDLFCYSLIKKF